MSQFLQHPFGVFSITQSYSMVASHGEFYWMTPMTPLTPMMRGKLLNMVM